jgi:hypothetical protein
VSRDESISIKAIVLSAQPPESVVLYLARINSEQFSPFSAKLVTEGRGVYRIDIPRQLEDFQYYVLADFGKQQVVFPITAPQQCQTVVVEP